jgi:hypothetical protein
MPTSFCNLSFSVFTMTQVLVMRRAHQALQVVTVIVLSNADSSRNKKILHLR